MKQPMQKLALVVPNFDWCDWDENTKWRFIPYNLCMLAAMVKDEIDVVIIDANEKGMDEAEFLKALNKEKPDIIGITVLMDQYGPAGHFAAKLSKKYDPDITVIMGGVYATINTYEVLKDENIDYVVIGEGEYVLKELLRHCNGEAPLPDNGVAYRKNGQILSNGRAELIEDLDSLPKPEYDLIDLPSYTDNLPRRRSIDIPGELPFARLMTSRGCPIGCIFCQVESISGKKFRARSADNIINEIEWLKNNYNIRSLVFDDDNLFTDKSRSKKLFKMMIDRQLNMPWVSISTAVFRLDEEILDLMCESGCEYIDIAIESGCERVLRDVIKKPVDFRHALKMVRYARNKGIYVAANFIVGFPTETWNEIRQTIRFAEELDVDYAKIFAAMPLPNTKLWELCLKENAFKKNFNKSNMRWSMGQIETDEFSPGDLTILRAYEWDRINFTSKEKRIKTANRMALSESELLKIRRKTMKNARTIASA